MFQLLAVAFVSVSHFFSRTPYKLHHQGITGHTELPFIESDNITFSNFTSQIGYDKRYIENQEELEKELTHLVHLHVMYTLYKSLQCDSQDINQKLDDIDNYYDLFHTQSMFVPTLHAGGLYEEWNFDM